MSKEFALRLKQYLAAKNVRGAQTRLAEHLDVSPQTVQQWVAGKTKPDDDKYPLIAEFFGITEIELRYGKSIVNSPDIAKYIVNKIDADHKTEGNISVEQLNELIGKNIASASLEKLLAIRKILEMKDEYVTGAHELIELIEQLLEKKKSNGE